MTIDSSGHECPMIFTQSRPASRLRRTGLAVLLGAALASMAATPFAAASEKSLRHRVVRSLPPGWRDLPPAHRAKLVIEAYGSRPWDEHVAAFESGKPELAERAIAECWEFAHADLERAYARLSRAASESPPKAPTTSYLWRFVVDLYGYTEPNEPEDKRLANARRMLSSSKGNLGRCRNMERIYHVLYRHKPPAGLRTIDRRESRLSASRENDSVARKELPTVAAAGARIVNSSADLGI